MEGRRIRIAQYHARHDPPPDARTSIDVTVRSRSPARPVTRLTPRTKRDGSRHDGRARDSGKRPNSSIRHAHHRPSTQASGVSFLLATNIRSKYLGEFPRSCPDFPGDGRCIPASRSRTSAGSSRSKATGLRRINLIVGRNNSREDLFFLESLLLSVGRRTHFFPIMLGQLRGQKWGRGYPEAIWRPLFHDLDAKVPVQI